jgi:hypothetical protein
MHLTATIATSARPHAPPSRLSGDRHGRKHSSSSILARRRTAGVVAIFRGLVTNSLEMRRTKFHYSVIGRYVTNLPGSRYVGGHSLNDEVSALNFKLAAPAAGAGFFPMLTCREAKNDASSYFGRSQLRTGGRKNHAKDCNFSYKMQVVISAMNTRMIRIDENIHATYPPYATVAPILHIQALGKTAIRGNTLNNGATDAAGR